MQASAHMIKPDAFPVRQGEPSFAGTLVDEHRMGPLRRTKRGLCRASRYFAEKAALTAGREQQRPRVLHHTQPEGRCGSVKENCGN